MWWTPFAVDSGGNQMVVAMDTIYEDTDPLVVAYPDKFAPIVATASRTVEQASAAPGEKRSTRR